MEKLIVIEGEQRYKYDSIEKLIQTFLSANYFSMSAEEKLELIEKKAVANTMQDNIEIIKLTDFKQEFKDNAFILYDENSYILSMLKFNKLILLERTDADIFGKYINKDLIEDNYIIVNKFANDILKKYLEEKCNG